MEKYICLNIKYSYDHDTKIAKSIYVEIAMEYNKPSRIDAASAFEKDLKRFQKYEKYRGEFKKIDQFTWELDNGTELEIFHIEPLDGNSYKKIFR